MGASICWTATGADIQFTTFNLSALKKQCLIFCRTRLAIEYWNLRFICYLELVIWDFKDAPKSPPGVNQSHVLREQILSFERRRARLPF
jgi:hypothetical protein